jgi:hypothetical protein
MLQIAMEEIRTQLGTLPALAKDAKRLEHTRPKK